MASQGIHGYNLKAVSVPCGWPCGGWGALYCQLPAEVDRMAGQVIWGRNMAPRHCSILTAMAWGWSLTLYC